MSELDLIADHYAVAIKACANRQHAAAIYADTLATYGHDGLRWNSGDLREWVEWWHEAIKEPPLDAAETETG